MGLSGGLVAAIVIAAHASGIPAMRLGGAADLDSGWPRPPHTAPLPGHATALGSPAADELTEGRTSRKLLHGCHSNQRKSCKGLPVCPMCAFPKKRSAVGHCKKNDGTGPKIFNCARRRGGKSRVFPRSIARAILSENECPNIHAASWPGHFDVDTDLDADTDYEEVVDDTDVFDTFSYDDYTPQFRAVTSPEELQDALGEGTKHIVIKAHLDMTRSPTVPDKPIDYVALDNAIGRVSNTTLSISGICTGTPPHSFDLREPMPRGACAIRVRQDFLDAPLGTTCLLIDSLYIVGERTASRDSAVQILHVDGLMMITNSVFQGGSMNSRAIDTNTKNGGSPNLYVKDTAFVGFKRTRSPGILIGENGILWLDNVVFRDIERLPRRTKEPLGSAVDSASSTLLVFKDVSIEENIVLGQPAGSKAVSVSKNRTELYASPAMEVWQAYSGPSIFTGPRTKIADAVIQQQARPQLQVIQQITNEIIKRESSRDTSDAAKVPGGAAPSFGPLAPTPELSQEPAALPPAPDHDPSTSTPAQ